MPKGRPKGSKNKPKEEPKKKRGRPTGSTNAPKVILPPQAESEVEPIYGYQEVTRAFGFNGYLVHCNIPEMALSPSDMVNAVEKYHARFEQLPKRVILHERNKHLLPFLYAQVPDMEAGLTTSTAIWEMKLQLP